MTSCPKESKLKPRPGRHGFVTFLVMAVTVLIPVMYVTCRPTKLQRYKDPTKLLQTTKLDTSVAGYCCTR